MNLLDRLIQSAWLGCVMVKTFDLRLAVGSLSNGYYLDR